MQSAAPYYTRNAICGLTGSTVFSTLSHNRHNFRKKKKKLFNIKCVFLFPLQLLFWNNSHSTKIWTIYDKKISSDLHVKCPLFLSDFNETLIFSAQFRKIFKYQISWQSNNSLFYQLDAQILYFNTFITFLYMFRALLCSSSGGQIVFVQPLVSSLTLGDCSVNRLRKDHCYFRLKFVINLLLIP